MENSILKIENLSAYFGKNRILKDINLLISKEKVTAIMG
ncbi:MAG: phosphate ABC transporter ATP-binding protein, partial [Caldiserica bacterium]|nr:phosphate ABC transporter ATP-binding protein [Caldisericota bacterium]